VGVAEEFDVPLADGLVSVGATVGVIGNSFQKLDRAVAFGVARVRHPALDLTTSVTAGRFRHGDVGAAVVKKGEFGAIRTDIGLLLNTDHEVGRAYRSRDRLQVVTIRQHVVALRDGAKRWYHASH
jgi:hypothetical protein